MAACSSHRTLPVPTSLEAAEQARIFTERLYTLSLADDDTDIDAVIANEFEAQTARLGGHCSRRMPQSLLHASFASAVAASFYSVDRRYLRPAEECYGQLLKRRENRGSETSAMYATYIRHRELETARGFYKDHHAIGLSPPPILNRRHPVRAPSILQIANRGNSTEIDRVGLDIKVGNRVLIVASVGCQASRTAASAVSKSPDLRRALSDALWLAHPEDLKGHTSIASWNREHPLTQFVVAYDKSGFEAIGMNSTPVFYFLRNGRVIEKISGWDAEVTSQWLIAAAARLTG